MIAKRKTNIELLRIFSMILIILHHYVAHGGLVDIDIISGNKFIGKFLYIGGKLGVVIFILIIGYFMVDSKFKIRKLIKIYLEVLFYSVGIYLILLFCNKIEFSLTKFIKSILPISYGQYWFVTGYIGLYIFSPFINKLIKNLDKSQYITLILIGTIVLVVIPTLTPKGKGIYSDILYFIYLYVLSGYLKKYKIKFIDSKKKCILLIITMLIFIMTVSIVSTFMAQYVKIFDKLIKYFDKSNSVPILILALSIFELFRTVEIRENKAIYMFARTSFAVYLIHDNVNFKKILWNDIFKTNEFFYANSVKLLIHIIVTLAVIYIGCTMIELIREKLFRRIIYNIKINKIETILDKIDERMNMVVDNENIDC